MLTDDRIGILSHENIDGTNARGWHSHVAGRTPDGGTAPACIFFAPLLTIMPAHTTRGRIVRAGIAWGQTTLEIDIDEANLVPVQRAAIVPNLADPLLAMRDALEH